MTSETTQPSLLDRVRDLDDQNAWRQFDAKYRELILRYCSGRSIQPADAEDVRQVVMMSLARALPRFDYRPEIGRFRDYLGTIVRNAIKKRYARQDRARAVLPLENLDVPDPEGPVEDELWNREWMLHHYRQAMAALRGSVHARSMEVFEELIAGRAPDEVARTHEMKVDAVYKIKQRMRERLTELVGRQLDEEEFRERRAE